MLEPIHEQASELPLRMNESRRQRLPAPAAPMGGREDVSTGHGIPPLWARKIPHSAGW